MRVINGCGYSKEKYESAFSRFEKIVGRVEAVDEKKKTISYEDFGAVGDGVANDADAMRAAHEAANEQGLPVRGKKGATYRIAELSDSIVIKTSTDWNGATIVFDDTVIPWNSSERSKRIFYVAPKFEPRALNFKGPISVSQGQTNVGITFDAPCMLKIEDTNEKVYKRYGPNANNGVNKGEMILVDADGNVDPSTPIQYNYENITDITLYSIDDEPITIGNARIETHAPNPKAMDPDYENNYCYYMRGIFVRRSNTCIHNVEYRVIGEDLTIPIDRNGDGVIDIYGADKSYGVPYAGNFSFKDCYNVMLADSVIQGHQAYSFWQGKTRDEKGNVRNEMGSYSINANDCVNLHMCDLVQYENPENGELITNRQMYHGIMGTNFCRNTYLYNCYLDRFDSHQGMHNAYVKDCTLGFGILVIGGGVLEVENTYRISGSSFVHLRTDYNSIFDGDLVIRNCRAGEDVPYLIFGNWIKFYNGLPNHIFDRITVDGYVTESGKLLLYNMRNATADSVIDDVNKLYVPSIVKLSDVYASDGETAVKAEIGDQPDAFASTEIIYE